MSENNGMTCAELADVAAELALGVLTGRERAMAVAHLDTCDACREDVRQLMATGEQLLELLPSAEPSAGFETRVLARLGLPARPPEPAQHRRTARHGNGPGHRGPAQDGTRPASGQSGSDQSGSDQSGSDQSGSARPSGGRTGGARRPRPARRTLAAIALSLAILAAGFGGWRIGVATASAASPAASPAAGSAAGSLASARLISAARHGVGHVFLYSGAPRWLYMSVDLGSGDETVTCQLVGAHGRVTTLGSFWLAGGYGAWGGPAPGSVADVTGARLVSAAGTVLATATFPHG